MGNATFGSMQIIYQFNYIQSGGTNIIAFQYADINTDGKKDIIFTSLGDTPPMYTYWLENLNNQGGFGPLQFMNNLNHEYLFYDLDNDADMDMLLWNPNSNNISWMENVDGLGTFSDLNLITTAVDFPADVKAADIDGDGWLDIASASGGDNKLAWYKNNTLGISENKFANYQIYPNPTKGILHIESKQHIAAISVFNILGQIIDSKQNTNQIDLSKAEAGVYLLKIEDEKGNSQTHKVVKE